MRAGFARFHVRSEAKGSAVYETTLFDPTGRVAGKSYTQTAEAGREVGKNWRNVYGGNTFQTVEQKPARKNRGTRKDATPRASDAVTV